MKKFLIIFILLFCVTLSSCKLGHIEDTNGEEDFTLSTLTKEDVFTYKSNITVGTVTKGYNNSFSFSCQKLSGNYLIKKIDSKNQHYGFTIDFQIEKGNAYFVLIKGEKIIKEIPHNQITTVHTDGGYEDIELRILGESCKVYINVTYGISD